MDSLNSEFERAIQQTGNQPVILCSSPIRLIFRKLIERTYPQITIMSYNEVTNNEETQQMAETTSTVTLQVGERVFLTEEEKEAKTIVLMVEYDKKQVEEETVYYKKLEETVRRKHNLY